MIALQLPAYLVSLLLCMSPMGGKEQLSKTEKAIAEAGFVDIHGMDKSIQVRLMYARPDNFTGRVLYTDLHHAYLHPHAARALVKAQGYLRQSHPRWNLCIMDAARPMHIQQRMWDCVKNTSHYYYVSNPAHGGGMHNYGLAVDITITNERGDTIPMGCRVDYMGAAAHTDHEMRLMKLKKISATALRNRRLLRNVMRRAGFRQLNTEWWHYNLVSRPVARQHYKVIP